MRITGELNNIAINFTPYIYANFINIGRLLSSSVTFSQASSLNSETFDSLQDKAIL